MDQAERQGQGEDLARLAHRLKGSLRLFGAGRADRMAVELETHAHAARLEKARQALRGLEQEVSVLQEDLGAMVAE